MIMSKTEGFTKYACDRTNYHGPENDSTEYLAKGDSRENDWHQVSRITADGNKVEFIYCSSCYQKYKELAAKQDAEFNAFRTESQTKGE